MPHPLDWLDDALADLDRRDLRRHLSARTGPTTATWESAGQSLINFGSNDYLGLAADPRLIAAAKSALDHYGWGSGASPLVTGRTELHSQLEHALANFLNAEAALLFPSGYSANVGTITSLVGKGDAIYSDQLNHASIIDGCRLSGAAIRIYPHSHSSLLPGIPGRRAADEGQIGDATVSRDEDLSQLREMLSQDRGSGRKLIVTDAIFSMHGTVAPVPSLAELAREFNAMLMVDEAHAIGVLGDHGRGLCETAECSDRVDIRIGTLSKALGGHGGFVAGSQRLIDWLANRARSYIFSTAAPPANAATGLEALKIVAAEPHRRQQLEKTSLELRRRLIEVGLIQPTSITHIIPVFLADPDRAVAAAAHLRRRGFYVPAIRPPSVPDGQSLLRISLTSSHTSDQINSLASALTELPR